MRKAAAQSSTVTAAAGEGESESEGGTLVLSLEPTESTEAVGATKAAEVEIESGGV